MEGESEYAFWHALVRDVCYGQIPRSQRADKHRAAAGWIERLAGDRVEDHAEILASHYSTALELARAAGNHEDVSALSQSTRRFLLLAGDRSLGLDVGGAEAKYRRALELTPDTAGERPVVLVRLGEALMQRARYTEADAAFSEAIEIFLARGDARAAAAAMGRHWIVLFSLGDPRMHQVVARALELLKGLPPGPELVACLSEHAAASHIWGDNGAAIAAADRALSLAAELGLPEPVRALGFRGLAGSSLGDGQGLADVRRAIDIAGARGLGREVAVTHHNLAQILAFIQGPATAVAALAESVEFADRRGVEEFVIAGSCSSLEFLVLAGAWDEALARTPELARRVEEAADMYDLLLVRCSELHIHAARGEVDDAPLADWTLATARDLDDMTAVGSVLPIVAAYRLAAGDRDGALSLLVDLDRTPRGREHPEYAANLPKAVRTALAGGDAALAASLVSGIEPVLPIHAHALATCRALFSEADGDLDVAAAGFADAADRWERFGVPYERALALLGQGRCLLVLGRATEASLALRAAREVLTSLRARPALAETDALLARAVALSS